jgi:hypothetical protein
VYSEHLVHHELFVHLVVPASGSLSLARSTRPTGLAMAMAFRDKLL